MHITLTPRRIPSATIVVLSGWIVHGFIEALLAACVIATASWPLYAWFTARAAPPREHVSRDLHWALAVFVLAPMVFACWSLLTSSLVAVGHCHRRQPGARGSQWWRTRPCRTVGGRALAQRPRAAGCPVGGGAHGCVGDLGYAQSLGQFTARHVLVVGSRSSCWASCFGGASIAHDVTRALQRSVGDRAQRYVDVATGAVRAAVSSMLVVGLFDAVATACAYAIAGAPRAMVWAAITGALAAVPFLGYVAVVAMAVELVVNGAATPALLSLLLGCVVLLCGDKVVRPMVARGGIACRSSWC
jgi:predicted PurR-regulated permease PerM